MDMALIGFQRQGNGTEMPVLLLDENQQEQVAGLTHEYPYVLHITDFTDFFTPWHWHEEVELIYVTGGDIEVTTSNETYLIHPGEAFFVNTNVLNTKKKTKETEHVTEYCHVFHPILLSGYFKSVYEARYLNPVLKDPRIEIVRLTDKTEPGQQAVRKLKELTKLQEKEHMEFQTRNLLSEIWLLLLQEIEESPVKRQAGTFQNQDRIRYMMTFIHQHYAEKLCLKQVADSGSVSERECMRCFQKNLNRSPVEYIIGYRLEKAREALQNTDEAVTDIALQCGFSGSAYFGKMFRKYYDMTPGDYRKKYGGKIEKSNT